MPNAIHFLPSIIFAWKAGAYPYGTQLKGTIALSGYTRLGWKFMALINTLAYCGTLWITTIKSSILLGLGFKTFNQGNWYRGFKLPCMLKVKNVPIEWSTLGKLDSYSFTIQLWLTVSNTLAYLKAILITVALAAQISSN